MVYLYGQGQSLRGPAFRIPLELLLDAKCRPLLDTFVSKDIPGSQAVDIDEVLDEYLSGASEADFVELYIPAPTNSERGEAFIYHTATRNFFAWLCKKSLIGQDLGSALVALLNSMSQFRSDDVSNVDDIVAYIDEEGYADIRNTPDHALAIMYFAEHFHFKDMWIDALAHCAGMCEKLHNSPGFEVCMSPYTACLGPGSLTPFTDLESTRSNFHFSIQARNGSSTRHMREDAQRLPHGRII